MNPILPNSNYLLVFFAIGLSAFAESRGQDQNPASYANPPRPASVVDDDFKVDTRSDYVISEVQNVRWKSGRLILEDGGQLYAPSHGGDWMEATVYIDFPELPNSGDRCDLKIWFDFKSGQATDSFVWLRQKNDQGKVRSAIFVCDTDGDRASSPTPQLVSQPLKLEGALPSGKWKLVYRRQLITGLGPKDVETFGVVGNELAGLDGVAFEASGLATNIERLVVKSTHPIPLNAEQAELINRDLVVNATARSLFQRGRLKKSLEILAKHQTQLSEKLGVHHPTYIQNLSNTAFMLSKLGDHQSALRLFKRSQALLSKTTGVLHQDYATVQNNLAELYTRLGLYEQAETEFTTSLETSRRILGEKNPNYSSGLNNLAGLYMATRRYAKAVPLFERSLAIQKEVSVDDANYSMTLNNLAMANAYTGNFEKAERLYRKTLQIQETSLGKDHFETAYTLNNIASLLMRMNRPEEAVEFSRRSEAAFKKSMGEKSPNRARSLHNLANGFQQLGELEQARSTHVRANDILRDAVGREHPMYASSLDNITKINLILGRYDRAVESAADSLQIMSKVLDRYSVTQDSSQQRIRMRDLTENTSLLISSLLESGSAPAKLLELIIFQKGTVLARQQHNHVLASNPKTAGLMKELADVASRLSSHFRSNPNRPDWKSKRDALTAQYSLLEQSIAEAGFASYEMSQAEKIGDSLPPGSCLISYTQFIRGKVNLESASGFDYFRHVAAIILRPREGEILQAKIVDLGPADPIAEAVASWRKPIKRANAAGRPIDSRGQKMMNNAGRELRKRIWQPIEQHIGNSELIIVSPDGALGRLPIIALPGQKPGSFLIEEKKIVYSAVPRLLPKRLGQHRVPLQESSAALLIGDIDYGKLPSQAGLVERQDETVTTFGRQKFKGLPNTSGEILSVQQRLDQAKLLSGINATETRFKSSAGKFPLLHIATHGFVNEAQPSLADRVAAAGDSWLKKDRSNLLVTNPNFLSGLAFADANTGGKKGDDGILFSAEIAMLPLQQVELAVLSACETGLGTEEVPGEGLVGIQRAFQVAGVKSTIASYWKVNDSATQMLMNKFYENLIEYGKAQPADQPDSNRTTVRIDALRDAQIWMLRGLNREQVVQLTRGVDKTSASNDVQLNKKTDTKASEAEYVSHPRYWAAFVLSGDWR